MFEKLWSFYYTHIDDKIEKITEPVGNYIAEMLPDDDQIDNFYGKIEKKGMRFFDDLLALSSDTPYVDGKKDGYTAASEFYKEEYVVAKRFYLEALREVKNRNSLLVTDIALLNDLLLKKKRELKYLQQKKQEQLKRVSMSTGRSIYDLQDFTLFPENRNLLDLISSKKLRELKKGYYDGFNEAKELFENRLNELKLEYENEINDKINVTKEYIDLYNDIQRDIESTSEQIISLSLIK